MRPRRSVRSKGRALASDAGGNGDAEAEAKQQGLSNNSEKHHKKRRKIAASPPGPSIYKPRGRGKLGKLPEMPLDILFEIFGNLEPLDVLHLARSTKALRGILMQRSAISVWKTAFLNVPTLPQRPSDMSEPEYANLAFSRHCHFCLASGTQDVFWAYRVRCCSSCLKRKFTTQVSPPGQPPNFGGLLPYAYRQTSPFGPFVLLSEREALMREILSISNDTQRLNQFLTERKNSARERRKHADQCCNWLSDAILNRARELDNTRKRRKEAILERLSAAGWDDEIKKLSWHTRRAMNTLPAFKQPKDLTDRIWENVEPALTEFFKQVKAGRLEQERRDVLVQRVSKLRPLLIDYSRTRPSTEIIPQIADICSMQPIRELLLDFEVQTPLDFAPLISRLPDLSEEWREAKKRFLFGLMPSTDARGKSADRQRSLSMLDLATTYFSCTRCTEPIAFPRILVHECMSHVYANQDLPPDSDLGEFAGLAAVYQFLQRTPWNVELKKIEFDVEASNVARSIIGACERDPCTTTTAEMDEMDPRLECLGCFQATGSATKKGRLVMSWKAAILHALGPHLEDANFDGSSSWKLVDEVSTFAAKEIEANKAGKISRSSKSKDVACILCKECLNENDVIRHLRYRHSMEGELVVESFTFRHLDMSMKRSNPLPVRISV